MTTERYKPCRGCNEILPERAFYWDKRPTPWKRRGRCIACMCMSQEEHNVHRPEERNTYKRQRRAQGKVG